ncbi:hypothetical protein L484_019049 [Morus notabilis]|uniref:Bifunctional inhibitor/plant lipid transfer protein/seed storage helical domain-containing protein n=2 Tax=Morus notabilis TaxID=981085 RepID=W9RGL4_9ROSA|nr:hypothetical protein L484_019049 [Morus notabilis]
MVSSTYVPACPPVPEKSHKHHPKTPSTPSTPSAPANPSPKKKESCPINTLKLGVCANVLDDLVHLVVGVPPKEPCCSLINGLADLEAAVCLCTALKANVLGVVNLNIPIQLSLLLNYCGTGVPSGFQCA